MNNKIEQTLVYCGNDCTRCPKFKDNNCGGCMTDSVVGDCLKCEPRTCCQERKLANCAHCQKFPCTKIDLMYSNWAINGFAEGAIICRRILDEVKNNLHS